MQKKKNAHNTNTVDGEYTMDRPPQEVRNYGIAFKRMRLTRIRQDTCFVLNEFFRSAYYLADGLAWLVSNCRVWNIFILFSRFRFSDTKF